MCDSSVSNHKILIIAFLVFLVSFFLIIGLTAPGLQMNDEWITVNQLHQLYEGHQVLTNEGKYGTVMGEMIGYFAYRHNILGYSLFIPIMSYIPLQYILTTGDNFRFWIILFWISIPLIISLLVQCISPNYSKFLKIPLSIYGLIISCLLLFINLSQYYPFPVEFSTAPIESAAVVLMENGVFAILCSIIFGIGWILYSDAQKAIGFSIALLCCSSYIFWATNAKDHLLTVFILGCIIISFLSFFKTNSKLAGILAFIGCGLLLWIRPEIGFTVTILVTCYYLYNQKFFAFKELSLYKIGCILLLPLFFFVGAIPFFANNYILTKNFLYPPYLEYENTLTTKTAQDISNVDLNATLSSDYASQYLNQDRSLNYLHLLISYFTPKNSNMLKDLWKICFFPPNGSVGLVIVSPLILIGVILLIIQTLSRMQISSNDMHAIILCGLISSAIFLAYIRNLPDQSLSEGIGPDMRYYSPIYLPLGIIALICMKYSRFDPITFGFWKKGIIALILGTPILIISLLLFQPYGGGIYSFNYTLSLINFGLLCLFIIMALASRFNRSCSLVPQYTLIGMILVSFSWQIMLVFLYSIAKFDGFTFWIPLTEQLFTQFIIPVG